MFRYLKDAFLYSPRLPGLGRIPWNLLALACIAILGFGNPGFWFLGAALEATYLLALSGNRRFQRLIDAEDSEHLKEEMARQRQSLVEDLTAETRRKLALLNDKRGKIRALYTGSDAESFVIESNDASLSNLSWLYLKLLVAQNTLQSSDVRTTEAALQKQIEAIDREVSKPDVSASYRESRLATQKILQKRLENFARREQSLKEIESDLERIEAQVDLALENAQMQRSPQAISANIELASSQLDDSVYGDASNAIAELEDKYRRVQSAKQVRTSSA